MGKVNDELLGLIGAGAPVVSGFARGRAIESAAESSSQAFRFNAGLARQSASSEAARIRREGKRALSRSRVEVAASGVQLEGSPLDHLVAQAAEIERQALDQIVAGEQTARLDQSRARSAKRAGKQRSASALLLGGLEGGTNLLRSRGVF